MLLQHRGFRGSYEVGLQVRVLQNRNKLITRRSRFTFRMNRILLAQRALCLTVIRNGPKESGRDVAQKQVGGFKKYKKDYDYKASGKPQKTTDFKKLSVRPDVPFFFYMYDMFHLVTVKCF